MMTPDRPAVQDPILQLIHNLPTEGRALHDIRLRFQVPDMWSVLSTGTAANSEGLRVDPTSRYQVEGLRDRGSTG
jgi:hypothetical protein